MELWSGKPRGAGATAQGSAALRGSSSGLMRHAQVDAFAPCRAARRAALVGYLRCGAVACILRHTVDLESL